MDVLDQGGTEPVDVGPIQPKRVFLSSQAGWLGSVALCSRMVVGGQLVAVLLDWYDTRNEPPKSSTALTNSGVSAPSARHVARRGCHPRLLISARSAPATSRSIAGGRPRCPEMATCAIRCGRL